MFKRIVLFFLILCAVGSYAKAQQAIIIDHTCTDISQIPETWIQQVRAVLRVGYGHTSHGSQLVTGIEAFRGDPGSLYYFTSSGWGLTPGLFLNDYWGNAGGADDLGHSGDLSWQDATRAMLNLPANDRNVVLWSWCGGVGDNTVVGINTYLNAMNQLEQWYPGVTFVYMTGHLDGSGATGNLHLRNEQIRAYCIANNKILFDFADIESHDPDGNYFLDLGADDGCYYSGGNWADQWIAANPGSELAQLASSCSSCAHSRELNCILKGRAFWWMMARIAGWDGNASVPVISITNPANGETFSIGKRLSVGWTTTGITGYVRIVLIRSDKSGGYLINSALPHYNSPYSYIIPDKVIPGSYFVRIKQGTVSANSGRFSICRITVNQPGPGQTYSIGDTIPIEWTAEGITGDISILLVQVDKKRKYVIAGSIPYDNSPFHYVIPAGIIPDTYVVAVKKGKAFGISRRFVIDTRSPLFSRTPINDADTLKNFKSGDFYVKI